MAHAKIEKAIKILEAHGFHITATQLKEILTKHEKHQEKKSR